ncbi:unnamed protein product, partial [Closterium sp. Yama58-4]
MANLKTYRQQEGFHDRKSAIPSTDAPPLEEPIAGYIFVCNNETMEDDIKRELFGLPQKYHESVRGIQPGMPLFLYNYTTHHLHGVFEASSEGGLNLDPSLSKFPSQVRVRLREQRSPLDETKFRRFLYHYDGPKFRLELSLTEANNLLRVFGLLEGGEGEGEKQQQGDEEGGQWEKVKPKGRGMRGGYSGGGGGGHFRGKKHGHAHQGAHWRSAQSQAGNGVGHAAGGGGGAGGAGGAGAGRGGGGGAAGAAVPLPPPAPNAVGGKDGGGRADSAGRWRQGEADSCSKSSSSGSGLVSPDLSTTGGSSSEERLSAGGGEHEAECNGNGVLHGEDRRSEESSSSEQGAEGEKAGEGGGSGAGGGGSVWSVRSANVSFAAVLLGKAEEGAAAGGSPEGAEGAAGVPSGGGAGETVGGAGGVAGGAGAAEASKEEPRSDSAGATASTDAPASVAGAPAPAPGETRSSSPPKEGFPAFPVPPAALLQNAAALHGEVLAYAEEVRPPREARVSAEQAVACVRRTVRSLWEGADVEVFGSFATGLALAHSDVDVAVINAPPPPADLPELASLSGARISAPLIRQLAAALKKQPWCESLHTIETARIPVIKLKCRPLPPAAAAEGNGGGLARESEAGETNCTAVGSALKPSASASDLVGPSVQGVVRMDITFSLSRPKGMEVGDAASRVLAGKLDEAAAAHNGSAARELVIERLKKMPALAPLVLLMKSYLHHRGLKDVYTGGLGSFSLTMMLVFYLERAPVACGMAPPPPPAPAGPEAAAKSPECKPAETKVEQACGDAAAADGSADPAAAASAENVAASDTAATAAAAASGGDDATTAAAAAAGDGAAGSADADAATGTEEKQPAAENSSSSSSSKASEVTAADGPVKGVVVDDLPGSAQSVPVPNLGVLLIGFLHLFGQEIDLSRVRLILRGLNGMPGGVFWRDPSMPPAALWIDDPLRPGANIGSGSFAMWHVQAAMREMLHVISKPIASPTTTAAAAPSPPAAPLSQSPPKSPPSAPAADGSSVAAETTPSSSPLPAAPAAPGAAADDSTPTSATTRATAPH